MHQVHGKLFGMERDKGMGGRRGEGRQKRGDIQKDGMLRLPNRPLRPLLYALTAYVISLYVIKNGGQLKFLVKEQRQW